MRLFGLLGGGARALALGFGGGKVLRRRLELRGIRPLALQRGALPAGIGEALGQAAVAVLGLLQLAVQRAAAGFGGGELVAEAVDFGLERRDRGGRRAQPVSGRLLRRRLVGLRRGEPGAFLAEPGERGGGIGGELVLALAVLRELPQALLRLAARRLDPPLLLVERLAGEDEALQLGAGRRLLLAQRGQRVRCGKAGALGGERGLGQRADLALGGAQPGGSLLGDRGGLAASADAAGSLRRGGHARRGGDSGRPACACFFRPSNWLCSVVMTSSSRVRLVSAALRRSSASWRRECRPLIPAASSSRPRRSIGLALMIAPMRPWLTSAVECAPVAASAKSSWTSRARTSRAVDAEVGARAALDAANHLELMPVHSREHRHRLAGMARVVEGERHLGEVAGRAAAGAAEDDVVHLAAAHALRRVLAHHPAQRLDEVRLAAAVRPDDAGQAGLDRKLGLVDEGFEAAEFEPGKLQGSLPHPMVARS